MAAMGGDFGDDFGSDGGGFRGGFRGPWAKAIGQSGSDWDRSGQIALARPNWWHRPEMEQGNCRTLSILAATWRSAHLAPRPPGPPGAASTWHAASTHLARSPPGAHLARRPPGVHLAHSPPGPPGAWPTGRWQLFSVMFSNGLQTVTVF